MANPVQRSFGRGEISPALAARADLDLYKAALARQRNFITPKSGGIQNRPGTECVGNVPTGSDFRLIPFVFSDDDAYALLFGDLYMRVIRDGAFTLEASKTITAITQASWAVVTSTAHGYTDGDYVYITTTVLGGMVEANAQTYIISNSTADTFKLNNVPAGTPVDSSAYTAYTLGGTVSKVYTLTTTFSASELAALDYAQYLDTMILAHPAHRPQKLTRTGHAAWAFTDIYAGSLALPTEVTATAATSGAENIEYKVTATYKQSSATYQMTPGKESLPGGGVYQNISGISNASVAVVTSTAHGLTSGDTVIIMSAGGMLEINNREYTVQVPSAYTPDTAKTIAAISLAGPMVVTSTAHGYSNGDKISFTVTGMVELNDIIYGTVAAAAADTFQVYYFGTTTLINSTAFNAFVAGTVIRHSPNPTATNTFQLSGIDSTNYSAFTSGGVFIKSVIKLTSASVPTAAAPHTISFGHAGVQAGYPANPVGTVGGTSIPTWNVYKKVDGLFWFLGSVEGSNQTAVFRDIGADPDFTRSPGQWVDRFYSADNYPSCVALHQQRLFFGNSNNEPQTVWASRIGDFYNFSQSESIVDSDGITLTVAGGNVDPIRHMVPMRILLTMCRSAETIMEGSASDAFAPGAVSVHQDSHNGSGTIKPLTVNNAVIFAQNDYRIIRDLFYSFQANAYDGGDITALASHMFRNASIVDMAYQKSPNSIIWIVLSDGTLVSCTYVKEQSILAFATHDTFLSVSDGGFLSVCCIPEGDETALYLVVNRLSATYVERMGTRTIADPTDIKDNIFVDCALGYDGRVTDGTQLAKVLSGTTYAAGELMRLHMSSGAHLRLATANIGDAIVLHATERYEAIDMDITCTIVSFIDTVNVVVQPNKDVPALLQDQYVNNWDLAILEVGGLSHLEGQDVSIQGDGWVIANPNNDAYDVITVSSGRVTLPEPHAVIWVGLPYVSDIQTCDLDNAQGTTIMDRNKIVRSVICYVNDTREFWAGESLPDDDSQENLKVTRPHVTGEETDVPPTLFSEPMLVNIKARWNTGGRVCVRNVDPLPCEIIAISPGFNVGS